MERKDFYKEGNKVLTDAEYDAFMGVFEDAEETCMEIVTNIRDAIAGIMNKLYEKCSSTEFVGERFTIINRFGDITFIDRHEDDTNERSLDEIDNESLAMDILADIL
jgi:hypothetical protein